MERRTALKILGASAAVPRLAADTVMHHHGAAAQAVAPPRVLQFFTPEENQLLDRLMETVLPADEHSPGAHVAQVSLFADLMVATSAPEVQRHWREGLRLMREAAQGSSLDQALAVAAQHEEAPQSDLERFFATLKRMTIDGYYTSAIGIHQDLQYQGNTYLTEFPGCTHPQHGATGSPASTKPSDE